MNIRIFSKTLAISMLLAIMTTGCGFIADIQKARLDRTDNLQSPLDSGSSVIAETSYGSITVTGTDTPDCTVIADITVMAPTETEAAEIAQQIKILLEKNGSVLTIKADKPRIKKNRSISISYKITVPTQTDLKANSAYGNIDISTITGTINAHTSYGDVTGASLTGPLTLGTSYGKINCTEITTDSLRAESSYGDINIANSPNASPEMTATANTSYGDIKFTAPPKFTGQVNLSTSYGSISTDLPITIQSKIDKQKINGKIGEGTGSLTLKTSYGSINLK